MVWIVTVIDGQPVPAPGHVPLNWVRKSAAATLAVRLRGLQASIYDIFRLTRFALCCWSLAYEMSYYAAARQWGVNQRRGYERRDQLWSCVRAIRAALNRAAAIISVIDEFDRYASAAYAAAERWRTRYGPSHFVDALLVCC